MRRRWRGVIVFVIVGGIVGLWALRSGAAGARAPTGGEIIRASLLQGERAYGTLAMTPIEALTAGHLAGAPVESRGAPGADAAGVLREAGAFLKRRFVDRDFDAYTAWRLGHGWRWKTHDELRVWSLPENYQYMFSRAAPEGLDVAGYMRALWDSGLSLGDGANEPEAVASEPRGMACTIGEISDPADLCQTLDGVLSPDLWHGPTSGTMRRWFAPLVSPRDLIQRHGRLTAATVGVVVRVKSGERAPLMLTFYFDPERRAWMLMEVNRSHMQDLRRCSPLEF